MESNVTQYRLIYLVARITGRNVYQNTVANAQIEVHWTQPDTPKAVQCSHVWFTSLTIQTLYRVIVSIRLYNQYSFVATVKVGKWNFAGERLLLPIEPWPHWSGLCGAGMESCLVVKFGMLFDCCQYSILFTSCPPNVISVLRPSLFFPLFPLSTLLLTQTGEQEHGRPGTEATIIKKKSDTVSSHIPTKGTWLRIVG